MSEDPQLPAAYRLVTLAAGADARARAASLAREGADDGTLVWSRPEEKAEGLEANLAIALVLYPESGLGPASQLAYVMGLGLADALGVVLSPGNEVFLEWPGNVLLNSGKVAAVTLDYPDHEKDDGVSWVVLGATVNIAGATSGTVVDTAILRDEGWPEATAAEMLPHLGRHFLVWVNTWLDDGFEPIRTTWQQRTLAVGTEVEVPLGASRAAGKFVEIDSDGCMVLRARNNRRRRIELCQTALATALPR